MHREDAPQGHPIEDGLLRVVRLALKASEILGRLLHFLVVFGRETPHHVLQLLDDHDHLVS